MRVNGNQILWYCQDRAISVNYLSHNYVCEQQQYNNPSQMNPYCLQHKVVDEKVKASDGNLGNFTSPSPQNNTHKVKAPQTAISDNQAFGFVLCKQLSNPTALAKLMHCTHTSYVT